VVCFGKTNISVISITVTHTAGQYILCVSGPQKAMHSSGAAQCVRVREGHARTLSLVGAAISIIFVTIYFVITKICHDRNMSVATKVYCDKYTFVVTNDVCCHDKHVFVMTRFYFDKNDTWGSSCQ